MEEWRRVWASTIQDDITRHQKDASGARSVTALATTAVVSSIWSAAAIFGSDKLSLDDWPSLLSYMIGFFFVYLAVKAMAKASEWRLLPELRDFVKSGPSQWPVAPSDVVSAIVFIVMASSSALLAVISVLSDEPGEETSTLVASSTVLGAWAITSIKPTWFHQVIKSAMPEKS